MRHYLGHSGTVRFFDDNGTEAGFEDLYCVKEGEKYKLGFLAKTNRDFVEFLSRSGMEAAILAIDGEVKFRIESDLEYDSKTKTVEYNVKILGGVKYAD